jgi:hypothetical protein
MASKQHRRWSAVPIVAAAVVLPSLASAAPLAHMLATAKRSMSAPLPAATTPTSPYG